MHQSTTSPQLNLNSTTACYLAKKLHLPFSNSVSSNVCSNKPGILAVVRQASTSSHEDQPWYDVDTDELVAMIQQNKEDMLLVDVREPEELQQTGVIPGSINIPSLLSPHIHRAYYKELNMFGHFEYLCHTGQYPYT